MPKIMTPGKFRVSFHVAFFKSVAHFSLECIVMSLLMIVTIPLPLRSPSE